MVDTARWTDSGDGYLTTKDFVGHWILRPGVDTSDRERRVASITLSTGTITHGGPDYSVAPSSTNPYEIHKLRPAESFKVLTDVMDQLLIATLEEITLTEGETIVAAPSWLTRDANLLKIMSARYLTAGNDDTRVFDKPYQKGRDYQLRVNPAAVAPYVIEWRRLPRFDLECWVEGLRPASDSYTLANTAAGESSPTVKLDARMVALAWARVMCIRVLNDDPSDLNAQQTMEYIDGPKGKIGPLAQLLADYEKDLITVQQEPIVLPTYRTMF